MNVTVLTLFPESLTSILDASILGRARKEGKLVVDAVDMRQFSTNKHRTVDDTPSGGGAGMVLRVDVVKAALEGRKGRRILVDARGKPFTQSDARRFASYDDLVIVCGRYEGVDARAESYVDEIVSIGDYVLTGGELAALVIVDAVARLLPGVLGNDVSSEHESHTDVLLEHRQYTKPNEFEGQSVPAVLLAGNHKDIDAARRKDALLLTAQRRPDLFVTAKLTKGDAKLLLADDTTDLAPVLK